MWDFRLGSFTLHIGQGRLSCLYYMYVSRKYAAEDLNRRADVETLLLDIAAGKLPVPSREECRKLALCLGTRGYKKPAIKGVPQLQFSDVLGVVACGWTHDKNRMKVMDSDLAIAIGEEVSKLFGVKVNE